MKRFRFHDLPAYAEVASWIGRARTILDVGCSEGFFLEEIEGASLRVGVDREQERLRQGKRDRPEVAFVRADATALPFAPGAFDRVVSVGVLPYVPQVPAALAEAARVLAPEGRLVVTSLSDHAVYRWLAIHWRRSGARGLRREDLDRWARQAGLEVLHCYEKGRIVAPALGWLYSLLSLIDRRLLRASSVVGPTGRWARALTNPLIHWEYRTLGGPGNTIYLVARKG